jgi:hypothetical protein
MDGLMIEYFDLNNLGNALVANRAIPVITLASLLRLSLSL